MPDVKLKFKSDTSDAESGINRLKKGLGDLSSKAAGFGKTLGVGAIAATGGIAALAGGLVGLGVILGKGILQVADYASELKDLSDATGISINQAQVFREAFRLSGVEMSKLESILTKLSNKIEKRDPAALEALKKLGIAYDDIASEGLGGRLDMVWDKISAITNVAQRASVVGALFGEKLAGPLGRLFGDSSRGDAKKMLGGLLESMPKVSATLERFKDIWDGMQLKALDFFGGVAEKILPHLDKLTDILMNLNTSSWGRQFGDILDRLINFFSQGDLAKRFSEAWKSAFDYAKDILVTTIVYALSEGFRIGAENLENSNIGKRIMNPLETESGDYNDKFQEGLNDGSWWNYVPFARFAYAHAYAGTGTAVDTMGVPSQGMSMDEYFTASHNGKTRAEYDAEYAKKLNAQFPPSPDRDKAARAAAVEEAGKAFAEVVEGELKKQMAQLQPGGKYFMGPPAPSKDELALRKAQSENEEANAEKNNDQYRRYTPVLSSLARIGGAKAEVASTVVNYQRESLKLQRKIEQNTRSSWAGVWSP